MKAIAGDNSRYFQISTPDDLYPQFNTLLQQIAVCPAVTIVPVTVGKSLFWLILVKYVIKIETLTYYNDETICKYYPKYYPTPILKYYSFNRISLGPFNIRSKRLFFSFRFISIILIFSTKFPFSLKMEEKLLKSNVWFL